MIGRPPLFMVDLRPESAPDPPVELPEGHEVIALPGRPPDSIAALLEGRGGVCIVDARGAGGPGLEWVTEVDLPRPHIEIILVVSADDEKLRDAATAAGVDECVDASSPEPDLLSRAVHRAAVRRRRHKLEALVADRTGGEGFHKGLLDAVGESVIVTDLDGAVVYWNRAAEHLYGWSADEAIGMDIVDLTPSTARRREALDVMETLRHGDIWRGEFDVRKRDGTTFRALVSNSPVLDAAGDLVGIIGVSSDLTAVKRTERDLRERNRELHVLNRISAILNRDEASLETRLTEVVHALPQAWRQAGDTEARLTIGARSVRTPGFEESEWAVSADFDVADEKGRLDVARASAPPDDEHFFDAEKQELVEAVARTVGVAIERASLRHLVAGAFSGLSEAVVVIDADRTIRYVNPAGERMFGYDPGELVGASTEILHEGLDAFRRFAEAAVPALEDAGWFSDDFYLRRKDGSLFEAQQTLSLLDPDRGLAGGVVTVVRDISGQRAAQREMEESEARFRQIAEHIEDVFWITDPEKSVIEYVSPAYERIWGRSVADLYDDPGSWLNAVVPEDRDRVRTGVEKQAHGPYTHEYRIRRPDGEERRVVDRSFTVHDEEGRLQRIIGVARDVTDERLVEERYGRLSEAITEVIYVVSPEGRVITSSPSVEAAIGYSREEFEGMDALEVVHPDDRPGIREGLSRVAEEAGKVTRAEYRVITREGGLLHVETVARNLIADPAVGGILVTSRDVTERHELERRVRQMQKMESIGRLAGGVAHDFNNILTVIRSQADLILMDAPAESVARDVEVIQSAADRAAKLTRQLLAFSREQVLQPRVIDLGEVVREASDLIDRLLGERIRVSYRTESSLPTVRVDPNRIEQVLVNLAVNARDAMPDGGELVIAVYARALDDEAADAIPDLDPGRHVVLEVTDTGTGMTPEIQQRMFEPFFTTKEKGEGTGLGLSMVYGTVRQSGGSIQVESAPGRGTSFYLYVPVTAGSVASAPSHSDARPSEGPPSATVLLVEDDPPVRKAAARVLTNSGIEVVQVGSGAAALAALADDPTIHLVVTDLGLGDMSGFQLLETIRSRQPDLPVVVMSGYAEGSPGRSDGLPPDVPFVQKPFTPAGLLTAVREAIAGSAGPRRTV